jgi:hypothetical protein
LPLHPEVVLEIATLNLLESLHASPTTSLRKGWIC